MIVDKTLDTALSEIIVKDHICYKLHEDRFPFEEMEKKYRRSKCDEMWFLAGRDIPSLLSERFGMAFGGYVNSPQDYNPPKNKLHQPCLFIFETYVNATMYSSYGFISQMDLWLGKSFIIGISQKGEGYDALYIDSHKIRHKRGEVVEKGEGSGAFDFYRTCKHEVFFDDPKNAKSVYLKFEFGGR